MSQQLPEVFKRIQDKKKEQRDLKSIYRDALSVSSEYQQIVEDFKSEFDKLEGLKLNIAGDNQLLSDLAVKNLASGEEIKIIDEYKVEYEPIFSVRFKKTS